MLSQSTNKPHPPSNASVYSRALDTLKHQVQYGRPLTLEQQRWCVEQLLNHAIGRRKRCQACGGAGMAASYETGQVFKCTACGGDGMTVEYKRVQTESIL